MKNKLARLSRRIEGIKAELAEVGEMRPGSLTCQKRGASGTYYQLSYTHRGKGRTEYVRPEFAPEIKKQIASYRRFKNLIEEWVNLEIERSRIKMEIDKKKAP
ncbi:MAG: hypothetical protein NTY16_03555 [Deltaproteobacteria bacterium]|nr:hypothetical protein [Deltaproteobacteria bacterium]